MSKIYFEMNEAERQLTHILDGLDYATCLIAEGIQGEYKGVSTSEMIDLQDAACAHLLSASECICKMLDASKK